VLAWYWQQELVPELQPHGARAAAKNWNIGRYRVKLKSGKAKRRQIKVVPLKFEPVEVPDIERRALARLQLESALRRVAKSSRDVLLPWAQGKSCAEIARETRRSPSTIRELKRRGLEKLREIFKTL
jgi:DNA-directed RNA polymerase specialized sigma24 family protein